MQTGYIKLIKDKTGRLFAFFYKDGTIFIKQYTNDFSSPQYVVSTNVLPDFSVILNENGIMQKGLMIRHLVLPNHIENSKKVLKWIKENIDKRVYVSVMAQYFPCYKAKEIEDFGILDFEYSIEDLQKRAKLSSTTIEKMRNMGILDGMDESSQLSLF